MTWWRWMMVTAKALLFRARRDWKEMEEIQRETTNVEYAWRLAPRWSCLTAATRCASTATEIGK